MNVPPIIREVPLTWFFEKYFAFKFLPIGVSSSSFFLFLTWIIIAKNHRLIIIIPIHHAGQYVLDIFTKIWQSDDYIQAQPLWMQFFPPLSVIIHVPFDLLAEFRFVSFDIRQDCHDFLLVIHQFTDSSHPLLMADKAIGDVLFNLIGNES